MLKRSIVSTKLAKSEDWLSWTNNSWITATESVISTFGTIFDRNFRDAFHEVRGIYDVRWSFHCVFLTGISEIFG